MQKHTLQIRFISFEEAHPLLEKLWPGKLIMPVDNLEGSLLWRPDELYLNAGHNVLGTFDGELLVGTTHCYYSGPTTVRIRGTYVEPQYRGLQDVEHKGTVKTETLGTGLVNAAIGCHVSRYSDPVKIETFPREGTVSFYEALGFKIDMNRPRVFNTKLHPHKYYYGEMTSADWLNLQSNKGVALASHNQS